MLYIIFIAFIVFSDDSISADSNKKKEKIEVPKLENKPAVEPVCLEFWEDVTSRGLDAVQGHDNYPNSPDSWKFIDTMQYDFSNLRENFGARIRGYIVPEHSLLYTFWVSSGGPCAMWLQLTINRII